MLDYEGYLIGVEAALFVGKQLTIVLAIVNQTRPSLKLFLFLYEYIHPYILTALWKFEP